MLNQVFRLVSERQFEETNVEEKWTADTVVVRPAYLSICAADQRYYTGLRGKEILSKKLPMALIHEGVGEVVYDVEGKLPVGTKVVMIPNTPLEENNVIDENYLPTSQFRASGYDGFMQENVFMRRDRVIPLPEGMDLEVAAYSELISVAYHAISRFDSKAGVNRKKIGVWGDGNLGYITCLLLKHLFPTSQIYIFGKTQYKLDFFSFVEDVFLIDHVPDDFAIDHAFECAGGRGSEQALEQIIDIIHPTGTVALLGVTEKPIEFNSRMVLEKGLTVFGSSRSGRIDFENTVEFLTNNKKAVEYLSHLIGLRKTVYNLQDITEAFEDDLRNPFGKTVMKWCL